MNATGAMTERKWRKKIKRDGDAANNGRLYCTGVHGYQRMSHTSTDKGFDELYLVNCQNSSRKSLFPRFVIMRVPGRVTMQDTVREKRKVTITSTNDLYEMHEIRRKNK